MISLSFSYIYGMNVIFTVIFCVSALALLFHSPDSFLSALLSGASKSAALCLSLLSTYAVWLGLMQVWEDSGVSRAFSKRLFPLASKLFKTKDEKTLSAVCMNLSVNLLGISGAATPYGIQAAALLDKTKHAEYASTLFFILNATSLQLFPTSIVAVRTALQSANPTDVVLPILLSSAFATLLGCGLLYLSFLVKPHTMYAYKLTTKGAGTR